ncbi:tum1 [Candida margitis]|uniref:tum1 n=1 Tax=Candida margitis TaxID=1775924 RepID=UPI002226F070|nr:tum1 [Candida margitis]KAI5969064.1 tum1 [Candida margitis]
MSSSPKFISIIKPSAFRSLQKAATTSPHRTIPIDATWFMPNNPRNAYDEFKQDKTLGPEVGAKFFDVDKWARDSPYPHMLPTQSIMNEAFQELGIHSSDNLVVYDRVGNFSSPRVAFTLKLAGHGKVYLLDNYPNYLKFDFPAESQTVSKSGSDKETSDLSNVPGEVNEVNSPHSYEEIYDREVIEYEEIVTLLENNDISKYLILDARSHDRFTGASPEPRPGLSSGHIPTAKNLPFTKVLNPEANNEYKTKEEIESILTQDLGVDLTKLDATYPGGIIVMCGTGVTACILKLALENIVKVDVPVKLYDGSWTEWAMRAPDKYIIKDV